jgi:hypothetical protein
MAEYTFKDEKTGREVTVEWNDPTPPTQQDALAVFAEAHLQSRPKMEKPDPVAGMSGYQKFMTGVGKGMTDIGAGALQRVLEGGEYVRNALGMESNQANIDRLNKIVEVNRAAFAPLAEQSKIAKAGEFIGTAAPMLPIPGGVSGGLLRRAGTAALSGGATGALQPTTKDESAADNAFIGALFGGGTSIGLSGAGKAFNAARGKLPPNMTEALSKKYGIRTTLGEASGNPIIQKAETWLEGVPIIGVKGFREKQSQEAEMAAKGFLAKYVVDPNLSTTAAMKEANDAFLDGLYRNVRASGANLPTVPADATQAAARQILDRYPTVFESIQDNHIKKILKNVISDTEKTTEFGFDDLWTLRKGLGKEIGDARTNTARAELKTLYAAVSGDMDEMFSRSGTDAGDLFRQANDEFKRLNVKFDVIRGAYDKAMGTTKAGEMFSPKKFSTDLKNLANDPNYKKNVAFSQGEIDEMTGLANIMQVTKRAGQFKENPPTGNRWGLPMIVAGTSFLSPEAALTEAGAAALTRFLTTTKAGKNLALAASKVEPESRSMQIIVNMIYNQLPKLAATGATRSF